MKRDWRTYLYAAGIFAVVVFCLWAVFKPEPPPGEPAVYERIRSLTDCSALQQEFDTAAASHDRGGGEVATSYMQAAQDRMRQLGC